MVLRTRAALLESLAEVSVMLSGKESMPLVYVTALYTIEFVEIYWYLVGKYIGGYYISSNTYATIYR